MERSKYLNKNALASGAAFVFAALYGAENLESAVIMAIIMGLTAFSTIRNLIAADVLKGEAEMKVRK
jgi:hypothetical protein